MAVFYIAIIKRESEGFGVLFPDVPGCTSTGRTPQDAAIQAERALHGHLTADLRQGIPLPTPTPLNAIEQGPEVDEAARVLVRFDPTDRYTAGENSPLDRTFIVAAPEAYSMFLERLVAPPQPSERLRRTMQANSPWGDI